MVLSRPLTVAVTGGIGAGKSTVSGALAAAGAEVLDSDQLAREVVQPGSDGLRAVAGRFGSAVIAPDGSLDRAALGTIVFADPVARADLEGITHPLVRALFAERVAAVPVDRVVVNDIPLVRTLREAARYHLVITVTITDEAERVRRLVARGHTEPDARARIAAQISDQQRMALGDLVLVNDGDPSALAPEIDRLWARLVQFAQNRCNGVLLGATTEPSVVTDAVRQRVADSAGIELARVMERPDGVLVSAPAPAAEVLQDNGFVTGDGGWVSADPGAPVPVDFLG